MIVGTCWNMMINRLGDGEILETRFETMDDMDGLDELFPSRNVSCCHAPSTRVYTPPCNVKVTSCAGCLRVCQH